MPASSSSPTAVLDAVYEAGLLSEPLDVAESITLLQVLSQVPDPRRARGRRHSLQSVLFLAVGAVLAGARSWAALAQWAAQAEGPVTVCGPTPHASTFGRVLSAVDAGALQRVLTGWVLARQQARRAQPSTDARPRGEDRIVVAVDGKTLRGARHDPGDQTKLVAVFDHAHRLVLSQAEVSGGDELAAFVPVLDTLPDLRSVLITADALHCQRGHADYLHRRGAHYLFTVKGNQPSLRRRWPGCRGRTPPACSTAMPDTAAESPARSRSSTWRARQKPAIPARRTGDQGGPPTPCARSPQAVGGDGVRDHLPGPPRRRPAAAGQLDPLTLDHRELAALGPRRHRG